MHSADRPSDRNSKPPARLAPERALPPYAYVPGRLPHPVSDPAGHSYGHLPAPAPRADPRQWRESVLFRFAIDLFNQGYYWEAHEAWESLWHACGRAGVEADFLKGLIKLAAAGVKAREGRPEGVRRHAARAAELFALTRERVGPDVERFFGLRMAELIIAAEQARDMQLAGDYPQGAMPPLVFPFVLRPE